VGRGFAKVQCPVVVGLDASVSEIRRAHLHGNDRRKHQRSLDAVAIHVDQSFWRRGWTVRFADTASVESEASAILPRKPTFAAMLRPGLAVADPVFALVAAVFDMRRSLAQPTRQTLGPQISRQISQVNV